MRATARIADVAFNTVDKLFIEAGLACAAYQDKTLRNLTCKRLQLDEIWSFVYAKEKNVQTAKSAPENAGDVWTWVAIDADSKLVPSWRIGDRTSETGLAFVDDLAKRLANRVQITSDGHRAYLEAIEGAFGGDVDYAQLVKLYGTSPESAKGRYSPAECTGARKEKIEGNPDMRHVSTSFAERQNLTMRMSIRRLSAEPPRSCRVGMRFIWRCIRMGMWRNRHVRVIVYHHIVGYVPVVRRRLEREPEAIMRAAVEMDRLR